MEGEQLECRDPARGGEEIAPQKQNTAPDGQEIGDAVFGVIWGIQQTGFKDRGWVPFWN